MHHRSSVVAFMIISLVFLLRGSARAQAWSIVGSQTRVGVSRYQTSSRALLTTVFSNTDSSDSSGEALEPATGWTHNLPNKDSSFWEKASGDATESVENSRTESQSSTEELRTGWLHNTEPKVESAKEFKGPSEAERRLQYAKMQMERNHRIVAPPAFHACNNGRQVAVTEHLISVPLFRDTEAPSSSDRLDVYFSIVEEVKQTEAGAFWRSLQSQSPKDRASSYVQHAGMKDATDMIVYLQGGPGFGAPTPIAGLGMTADGSWAGKALGIYKRVVLMDQRGTGRSTPITKQTLEKRFPDLFALDESDDSHSKSIEDFKESHPIASAGAAAALGEATNYMAQFRADNIVQDAELIREALLLPTQDERPRPWGAALGQSFGGFCMMTYLSQVQFPPKICLLTGGVAPMLTPAYEAYQSLWERVKERSLQYYDFYPGDISVVKRIVAALLEEPAKLPSGGLLTARRFLNVGLGLGSSPSAFASFHALFSTALLESTDEGKVEFSRAFLKRMDSEASFDDAPIYFLMHESIYADGPKNSPTQWAAHRAYENLVKTPSEYDYRLTCKLNSDARPTLFFGEMVFPWFADGDFAEVSGLGMRSLAHSLANKEDWGPLYDAEHMRQVLADGSISKAAAALYLDDMYVDFNEASKVIARGGPLEKCKVWATNEYQHSGLRDNGAFIFEKLHGMATGAVRTPS